MPNDPAPIVAAGGLLWRPSARHTVEVALVHRPRYKDWSLPKGKAVEGETAPLTAAREVMEETGFRAAIGRRLTTVRYTVSAGPKQVEYYAARLIDGDFAPNSEVDKLRWLPLKKARERMTYEFDCVVLDTFALHPAPLTSIVLLRHCKAGVRESWEGPDQRRPLDVKGRKQAQRLREELAPFVPTAIFSAPIERCRASVVPLAKSLGVPVELEESLTEQSYRANPAGARRLLSYLGKVGQPAVVCSQGGVIPGVVKSLAGRAQLKVGQTSTHKGGYWVLTFDGSTLVQADPYPAPAVG